jgi:hypothetical protein
MTGSNIITAILIERPKRSLPLPSIRHLLDCLAQEWNSQLGYLIALLAKN